VQSGPLHPRGCLFCLRSDRPFTSVEHIIPAGLGNADEAVLPRGVICDRCNNGPLSKLDRSLMDHPVVNFMRTVHAMTTRSGRIPESSWGNALVTSPEAGHLVIVPEEEAPDKDVAFVDHGAAPDGTHKLTLSLRSHEIVTLASMRVIMRAIFKMGLEFIYVGSGADVAYDEKFDDVRLITLGRVTKPGWLLAAKHGTPHPNVHFEYLPDHYIDGAEIVPLKFDLLGVVYVTEMLARDPSHTQAEDNDAANVYVF
jgi:hypothetical protein